MSLADSSRFEGRWLLLAADVEIHWDDAALAALVRRPDVRQKTREGAERIRNRARELVRVDTGELRDSIRVIEQLDGFLVGSSNDHADENEFGTAHMPAQPFMRPAMTSETL